MSHRHKRKQERREREDLGPGGWMHEEDAPPWEMERLSRLMCRVCDVPLTYVPGAPMSPMWICERCCRKFVMISIDIPGGIDDIPRSPGYSGYSPKDGRTL